MTEVQESLEKKEFKDILNKCRCCLRLIIDDRRAVKIDDAIRDQFYNLTTISLLNVDVLANRICQLCASDLQTFSNLRMDLIEKQSSLYAIFGLDHLSEQESSGSVDEEVTEGKEEIVERAIIKDDEVEYELIERDGDQEIETELLWEEALDESCSDNNEESTYFYTEEENSIQELDAMLKIEKVDNSQCVRKRPREEMEMDQDEYYEESLEEYSRDIDSTLDEEVTECSLCGIQILHTHISFHSELMHVDVSCEKCDKTFPSKVLLKKHEHIAHAAPSNKSNQRVKRKIHFCGLCDKEYEYKKHLEDHVRSFHKKERNRQCSICSKFFYHRDIKKHIEHVHGEKKVKCGVCGKLYTCLENLKLHMRYHEEPRFVCEIGDCGKKFRQKILWEHHQLKHSTEKQIECKECGNSFYTVRDLNRHTQRVHKKVTRKCFSCDALFYRKDKYREHVLKSHKELSEEERVLVLDSIRTLKWNDDS